ncbi:MAG: sulfotransferase domain-containing protein [Planctomycetota bacterium]
MSYRSIRLDRKAPLLFRIRAQLRKTAPARWAYRRRWNRMADVMLLSFPKAGRTWLRMLLAKTLATHCDVADDRLMDLQHTPGVPRIKPKHDDNPHLKTPGELVTRKTEYADHKVILLVRDIRDLAVSAYFEATRRRQQFVGDISQFLRCQRGGVDTMIRFYNIWAANRNVPRGFCLVRYEDLHADASAEVRRILDFVGVEGVTDETIRQAVAFASFENMNRMERTDALASDRLRPGDPADPESYKVRRGKVGGYRDYMDPADAEMVRRKMVEQLDPMYYGRLADAT